MSFNKPPTGYLTLPIASDDIASTLNAKTLDAPYVDNLPSVYETFPSKFLVLDNDGQVISRDMSSLEGALMYYEGGNFFRSYTDGELLIGNSSGNRLSKSTLTAGNNIKITNGEGSIGIGVTGTISSANIDGTLSGKTLDDCFVSGLSVGFGEGGTSTLLVYNPSTYHIDGRNLAIQPLAFGEGGTRGAKQYLTSGTSAPVPTGATLAKITLWGAGGGGGNGATNFNASGGGGGAGACIRDYLSMIGSNTSFTYSIGAGGTANSPGGNTTILLGSGTLALTAYGGGAGSNGSNSPTGVGGGGGSNGAGSGVNGGTATNSSPNNAYAVTGVVGGTGGAATSAVGGVNLSNGIVMSGPGGGGGGTSATIGGAGGFFTGWAGGVGGSPSVSRCGGGGGAGGFNGIGANGGNGANVGTASNGSSAGANTGAGGGGGGAGTGGGGSGGSGGSGGIWIEWL